MDTKNVIKAAKTASSKHATGAAGRVDAVEGYKWLNLAAARLEGEEQRAAALTPGRSGRRADTGAIGRGTEAEPRVAGGLRTPL
jgi:hypothetical protein